MNNEELKMKNLKFAISYLASCILHPVLSSLFFSLAMLDFLHSLPNEILFFGYFIILACTLLGALRMGKEYVVGVVAILAILANVFVIKPYEMFGFLGSFSLFGKAFHFPLVTYGGNEMFGAIFLATNLLTEHFGKTEALKAVRAGFIALFLYFITATVYTSLTTASVGAEVGGAINTVFSPALGIVVASLTAFATSNTLDTYLYAFIKSHTGERHLWFRGNASTMVSQFVDTCIFSFIAVYFGFFDLSVVWGEIFFAYAFKIMMSIINTPFLYLSKWTQTVGRGGN